MVILDKAVSDVKTRSTILIFIAEDGKRRFIVKANAWRFEYWVAKYRLDSSIPVRKPIRLSVFSYDIVGDIRKLNSVNVKQVAHECQAELYNGHQLFYAYMSCGGKVRSKVIRQRFIGYYCDKRGMFIASESDDACVLTAWVRLCPVSTSTLRPNAKVRSSFQYDPDGSWRRENLYLTEAETVKRYASIKPRTNNTT